MLFVRCIPKRDRRCILPIFDSLFVLLNSHMPIDAIAHFLYFGYKHRLNAFCTFIPKKQKEIQGK